jgi:TonB family protein
MRAAYVFLTLVSTLTSVGFAQTKNADQVGFIYCANEKPEQSAPVFLDACMKRKVGTFPCGHKLQTLARSGAALKILTSEGATLFVSGDVVSQKADELIPVEVEGGPAPTCEATAVERDPTKNRGPRPVFQRDPDYPEHARRTRDTKTVYMALVVGTDGQPHDIKVEGSPGKDFAKNAVAAVQQWRFDPALKDGQPVEWPIQIEITFRKIY